MNRFRRAVDRVIFVGKALTLLVGLLFLLVVGLLPLGGFVIVACPAAWLLYRSVVRTRRDWSSNVHGENAYQILGVGRYADVPTIRRAFRELERRYHPDAVPPERKVETTAIFIRINQAYELLSSDEWRYEYDGLIDSAGGRIPPFEETFLRIRNEDKNPIYAAYDALHPPQRNDVLSQEDQAPSSGESGPCDPPRSNHESSAIDVTHSAVGDAANAVVEVEIPESIREAMGLPPSTGPNP